MRAQEILEKLNTARMPEGFSYFSAPGTIGGIQDLSARLEALDGIPGFEDQLLYFKNSMIFRTALPQIEIQPSEWQDLNSRAGQLHIQLFGVWTYLSAIVGKQDVDAIYIKLPDTADFGALEEWFKRIDKALSQVILHPTIGGRVELRGWERGSLWLEIFLGVPAAVSAVGTLAWAAAVVYKKIQEAKLHEQYVRGLRLRNDQLEVVLDAQKALLNAVVQAEAEAIAKKSFGEVEPGETAERLKFTIREFADMMEKGAEIHPALKAPENVRNLFPDPRKLALIESQTKLLTGETAKSNAT